MTKDWLCLQSKHSDLGNLANDHKANLKCIFLFFFILLKSNKNSKHLSCLSFHSLFQINTIKTSGPFLCNPSNQKQSHRVSFSKVIRVYKFSGKFTEGFENTYFIQHLRTTVSSKPFLHKSFFENDSCKA